VIDAKNAAKKQAQPIATPTIARIYAQQGKLSQSAEVYQQLLKSTAADDPLAATLSSELSAVQRRLQSEQAAPPQELDSLSVETATEASGKRLRCRFCISDAGTKRARLVIGGEGQLTLRVAGFPAHGEVATRDTSLDQSEGTVLVSPPAGASLVTAAIGLLDEDGNFASIAHCDMVQL
jgi:hypothetical protein